MNLIYTLIGIVAFILIMKWWSSFHKRTNQKIEQRVKSRFINKGYKIVSIENAQKNPNSPFYKQIKITPSTGISGDFYKHRYYKLSLIDKDGETKINWVDCLYFIHYNCYFNIKETENKDITIK